MDKVGRMSRWEVPEARRRAPLVALLVGGGVDSSVLADMYSRRGTGLFGVHYDYGQEALPGERQAARRIARKYKFRLRLRRLSVPVSKRGDEFLARNALMILGAAAEFGTRPVRISFGAHAHSQYFDCSQRFIETMQRVLDGYFEGRVILEAPLLTFNKSDIVAYARRRRVPIAATFSCTRAARTPCGKCPSCLDRRALGI